MKIQEHMINPENLRTITNYAKLCNLSYNGVVKRIKSKIIETITIDGMQFIDIAKFPPTKKR